MTQELTSLTWCATNQMSAQISLSSLEAFTLHQ